MAYATLTDLAQYLARAEADLPADSGRLLERASELVDYLTMDRVNPTDLEQMGYVTKAVCGQVEYWLSVGEVDTQQGQPSSYSIGDFSIHYGKSAVGQETTGVAPRMMRQLFLAGLLSRAVYMSLRSSNVLADSFFGSQGGS